METRKFTPSQKERFLKLASKEIGLIKPSNEELWEEIKKIKRKIGDNDDGDYDENIVDQLIGPDISRSNAFDVPDMGEDVAALFAGSDPVAYIEELKENKGDESVENIEDSGTDDFNAKIKDIVGVKEPQTLYLKNISFKRDDLTLHQLCVQAGYVETHSNSDDNIQEIIYKNPKDLSDFLLEYNQDQILKYTCHTIDSKESVLNILEKCHTESYEYQKHLELIHRRYSRLTFKFKDKVMTNIVGLISRYLGTFNINKGWSENIKIKWISPELENWCKQNPGKVPNPLEKFQNERFRFTTIELKNGESISNFSDLVIHFKNLFHIKSTNPLKPIIEQSIFFNFREQDDYKFSFAEDFSDKIDLFTYTEALIQAFDRIVVMSKKYYEKETLNVKLCFDYDESNLKLFKIIILNSKIFGKNYVDFRGGDDIKNLIIHQVNGLCNFYVKAYFDDKKSNGLVNIWDGKAMEFEPIEGEIEGVEFILKMY